MNVAAAPQQRWEGAGALQTATGPQVAPLNLPEVLEHLVRETEPLLTQLGLTKEVSSKKWSNMLTAAQQQLDKAVASANTPIRIGQNLSPREDDLDVRLAKVKESTGYLGPEGWGGSASGWCFGMGWGKDREPAKSGANRRRKVAIFTTASLPWMTGTAINPLLRAAYLAKARGPDGGGDVTLLVPWLSKGDQECVYPNDITFDTPQEQERYVRDWLAARVGFQPSFKIAFYPGKFSLAKRSILAVGDISAVIPDRDADVAVLEEPEHLTWYYHGRRWTRKFKDVVGIIHTNYLEYVRREKNGPMQAFLLEHVNNWMTRIYCNQVIRLSGATQNMPRSMICNVHGVGIKFLDIGHCMSTEQQSGKRPFSKGAYYLGKLVWSKGYRELVDLLSLHQEKLGSLRVDVFGSGEDADAVRAAAEAKGLRMKFHKGMDHADTTLQQYKVFINPSLSDVVCTTSAEALAMGKIVVCADHPSNEFFKQFPNCFMYRSSQEFAEKVQSALASEPVPLTPEQRHLLSWEAATDRFLDSAGLSKETSCNVARNRLRALKTQPAASAEPLATSPRSRETPPDSPSYEGKILESIGTRVGHLADAEERGDEKLAVGNLLMRKEDERVEGGVGGASLTAQIPPRLAAANRAALLKTLSLSLASPNLATELTEEALYAIHWFLSGIELCRKMAGALPGTTHVEVEQSKELGLPPPSVQRPVYGW